MILNVTYTTMVKMAKSYEYRIIISSRTFTYNDYLQKRERERERERESVRFYLVFQ